MADVQAEIQAAAEEMVASGAETGLQIAAVMRNGPAQTGLAAVIRIDRLIAERKEHR